MGVATTEVYKADLYDQINKWAYVAGNAVLSKYLQNKKGNNTYGLVCILLLYIHLYSFMLVKIYLVS